MFNFVIEAFSKDEDIDRIFLFGSPLPPLIIVGSYLIFVLKIGPEYVKNRRPIKLKKILLLYNILQVLLCSKIVFKTLCHYRDAGFWNDFCVVSTEPYRSICIEGAQLYMLAKYIELFDTVFFVLRKKKSQVSLLHVYHHSSMVIISYLVVKFAMSEVFVFSGAMNSFVHVLMYSYYALAALGPDVAKYLWWKKYLTKFQMTSFFLMLLDASIREYRSLCPRNAFIYLVICWQFIVIVILFSSFYKKTYKNAMTKAK